MDIDHEIATFLLKTESGWSCSECGFSTHLKSNVTTHIEAKHIVNTGGVACNFCEHVSPTRHALKMHISRKHKNK